MPGIVTFAVSTSKADVVAVSMTVMVFVYASGEPHSSYMSSHLTCVIKGFSFHSSSSATLAVPSGSSSVMTRRSRIDARLMNRKKCTSALVKDATNNVGS